MPIRFAPARHRPISPVARAMRWTLRAAHNDNACGDRTGPCDELAFRESIEHFALHGLGSAKVAASQAIAAIGSGDRTEAMRWVGLCEVFDKQMADRLRAPMTKAWLTNEQSRDGAA